MDGKPNRCYVYRDKHSSLYAVLFHHWQKHAGAPFSVLRPYVDADKNINQYKKVHYGFKFIDIAAGINCMHVD